MSRSGGGVEADGNSIALWNGSNRTLPRDSALCADRVSFLDREGRTGLMRVIEFEWTDNNNAHSPQRVPLRPTIEPDN
jgi:hypothetical protein